MRTAFFFFFLEASDKCVLKIPTLVRPLQINHNSTCSHSVTVLCTHKCVLAAVSVLTQGSAPLGAHVTGPPLFPHALHAVRDGMHIGSTPVEMWDTRDAGTTLMHHHSHVHASHSFRASCESTEANATFASLRHRLSSLSLPDSRVVFVRKLLHLFPLFSPDDSPPTI